MTHTTDIINRYKLAHDTWSNKMLNVTDHNMSFEIASAKCSDFETIEALEAEIARYYN